LNSIGFMWLDSGSRLFQAYVVYAIIRAAELVTRKHVKRHINKKFPFMNNTRLSFAMLYSYQEVYENTDCKVLSVTITIEGTKYKML